MKETPILYQYSSAIALQQGLYDGDLTIERLKKQGTYGLGSFNALEGDYASSRYPTLTTIK